MSNGVHLMMAVCRAASSVGLAILAAGEYFGRGDHVAAGLFVIASILTMGQKP